MRFYIFVILLVISVSSSAQWTIINGKQRFAKGLGLPVSDTMPGIANDSSQIILRPIDSTIWFKYKTNWQQLGKPLDTTSLSNRIDLRVKYSDTANMLLPYLRKADTAAMLSPYLRKIDTASLSNRINLKLNISDTAAMLSPYLRTNIANATFIDSVFIQNDSIKYRKNGVSFASTPADTATVVKAYVTNAEAVTITKGQVVYIFGAQGDRASVKLAKNTSDTFSSKTLGIVRADIAAGQAGWVTTQGQVSGINLGAYTAGDILWLDSVAGGFTKTKPVAPKHGVFIGVVERANAGNGIIYVKPQNGVELDEVHNVLITSPTNNQVLSYTASTGIWENKSVTTALGYTPVKINIRDTIASQKWWVKDSLPITTARRWALVVDTSTNRIERQNLNIFRRDQDTVPLAVFNVGSAAAGDTAAFSTSTLAGSFYLDGTDTMFVTSYRVALQGTSASITPEVWFNDSLNVTAGGTRLATGSAITNLTTGTSVTATTNKIPPANFVFVRFSAVTTKPTYFTLTLFGYRIRKQ